MPRQPRIQIDGLPLHIVQRGHNHQPCFSADQDRAIYLYWLGRALQDFGCHLHAYVLMTNHVHLLLTPDEASSVPRLIMSLGRRYVQYFNHRHERSGTLWDSRYKSSLVDTDAYLLACHRYIELNPVRAGLADSPSVYRWSSYRANALGVPDSLVTPHPLYLTLADGDVERGDAYRRLFEAPDGEREFDDIRRALRYQRPLGSREFHARIERDTGILAPRPRGRPPRRETGAGDASAPRRGLV